MASVSRIAAWAFALSPLFLFAQNVGIGTSTPQDKLHIAGEVRVDPLANPDTSLVAADVNGRLILVAPGLPGQVLTSSGPGAAPFWGSSGNQWLLTGNTLTGTEFIGSLNGFPFVMRTNNVERARISAQGLVGIHTPAPAAYLHVNTDSLVGHSNPASRVFRLSNSAIDPNSFWDFRVGQSGFLATVPAPANANPVWNLLNSTNANAFQLNLSSTATNVIQTDANGNVGMGVFPSGAFRWQLQGNGGITESGNNAGLQIVESGNGHGLHVISQSVAATDRQLLVESDVSTLGSFARIASNGQGHIMEFFSGRDGDPNPYIMVSAGEPIRFVTNNGGFCENVIIRSNGNMDVRGVVSTGVGMICPSDARFKRNIRPIGGALSTVLSLQAVRYEYDAASFPGHFLPEKPQIGLIAQEVAVDLPELVHTYEDGYLGVDYAKLSPVLVKAIQEQQAQMEALAKENADLKARLERLEERMK